MPVMRESVVPYDGGLDLTISTYHLDDEATILAGLILYHDIAPVDGGVLLMLVEGIPAASSEHREKGLSRVNRVRGCPDRRREGLVYPGKQLAEELGPVLSRTLELVAGEEPARDK